jgi:hypothetical protein
LGKPWLTLPKFTVETVVPKTMNLSIVRVSLMDPNRDEADRDRSPEPFVADARHLGRLLVQCQASGNRRRR